MDGRIKTYCKLYVDYDGDCEQLAERLCELLASESRQQSWHVLTEWGYILIDQNEDYDALKRHRDEDGFYYYQYLLSIDKNGDVDYQSYVNAIGGFLILLWNHRIKAVAACAFEDELPYQGKYL